MTVPATQPRHSIEEYYRIENDASEKHEYWDGQILAMSGGSSVHSQIGANVILTLGPRLRGKPCRLYNSELRVRIAGDQRTVYPDVSVICGAVQHDPDDKSGNTVLNPRVVIEVLSTSTEAYDRGSKFAAYRSIESMEEYVLVSQSEARVETFLRQPDGTWSMASVTGIESSIRLRSLQIDIPLDEVYAGVQFPEVQPPKDSSAHAND